MDMGYVIVDNKKYKITEIEGDEIYYRDEYGIEHAVPLTQLVWSNFI